MSKDIKAREVGNAALDQLRRKGVGPDNEARRPAGLGVTIVNRDHVAQLLTAWAQVPEDGTDYEWSVILHDCARHLLEHGDR